ncbi:Matrixin family protein [Aphelenchoides avenae]|nr:Matrixin family protein [Aphelenchus avenae]
MREKGLIRRVFYDAVSLWNEVSGLEIRESQDPDAEIQMSFQTGQHGDYYPFDGRDRILENWFWRFDVNGSLNASPRTVSEFWRGLPTPVDAAFELNDHVFFFVGKKCYEYWGRSLVTVRNLTDFGLPADLQHVRLAYSWNYGNEAKYYIWSDEEYWKIDIRDMRKEVDYPRPISLNWKGIPSDVSAATIWGKDLLFFGDGELYKFGSYKMSVARGYPKPFSHTIKHCMPRAEALVGSRARTTLGLTMNYGDQQPQQPPQQQYQMRMNQPRMMQMGQMQQHPQYMQPGMQYMQPMQGGVPMPQQAHMYQQQPQQAPQMANANQQQAKKMQLEQLVRSFPPEVQQQIHSETDHNRKLNIIKEWAGKTRQQQNMMSQHPVGMHRMMPPGQAGGPMYAQPQMPGQPQPMTSGPVPVQRIPSGQGNFQPSSGVAPQGIPPHMMGQPGMQPGMMPQQMQQQSQMQPGMPPQQQPMMVQQHVAHQQQAQQQNFGQAPQQAHTPQHHMQHPSPLTTPQSQSQLSQQPMPTPPQAATPQSQQPGMPPSVHSTPGAQSHNSPMPAAGYPPGGPSSVGPPRSIPSQYAGSPMAAVGRPATPSNRSVTSTMSAQQPEVDTNTPEYKAALEKLRQLREPCLKLIDKLKLQRDARWEKSVERVYEIMEGKRPVDPKLMLRLENNLLTLIAKNNVATPLINLAKKLSDVVLPSDFKMRTPLVRDRWACVKHLEIKPLTHLLDDDEEKPDVTSRKRKRGQDDASEEPPVKTADSLITASETVVKMEPQDEILEVSCLKGTIRLTPEASRELQKFNFRFDPDFTPISAHSPYVQVLIDYNADKNEFKLGSFKGHLVPPLRLLVPREYPKEGATVQLYYDSSEANDDSATIVEEMKTRIDSLNLRTISEVVDAWRLVVAQYTKQNETQPSTESTALPFVESSRA